MSEVIVIGAGAAGMFCSILAAERGHRVTVLEKNEKAGKKLFITGKGRCNFTNCCSAGEFLANVVSNPKFLYSAGAGMTPEDVIARFESWGLRVKMERGRRMFPESDHSSDVIRTLTDEMRRKGVRLLLHTEAEEILTEEGHVTGVRVRQVPAAEQSRAAQGSGGSVIPADNVVVATGGLSYPSTGSTGDGYRFAAGTGHRVTECRPSLVPLVCEEEYVREMQGLSLRNVRLEIRSGKKELFSEQGEMMFTHFGITGPLVLSASAVVGGLIGKKPLVSRVDLKPALTEEQLDARLLRIVNENPNKILKNVLPELYPSKMHGVILTLSKIDPGKKLHSLTKEERSSLIRVTKSLPLTITALRGWNEAVITKGGVSVRDIRPGTMESRIIKGLFFIGEVLDLDAYTGGYNLQIAWCTAGACAKGMEQSGKENDENSAGGR